MSLASLVKNARPVTSALPKPVVTWDKAERIRRNQEIWADKNSIVHRLPEHYKRRYWDNILADAIPVHYRPHEQRFSWDTHRLELVEHEVNPIIGLHVPERDEGLWGGEGIVKGWRESKPYTRKKVLPRHWVPRLFFPKLRDEVLYSEVLDKYLKTTVTERAMRLIDQHNGLDFYLLETRELDLASKLGNTLKRTIMIALAKGDYHLEDKERHAYIRDKYARLTVPLEEAEWVGLDLNEAARKQQMLEETSTRVPLKYELELDLVEKLRSGKDMTAEMESQGILPQHRPSLFGEKLLGNSMKLIARKFKS